MNFIANNLLINSTYSSKQSLNFSEYTLLLRLSRGDITKLPPAAVDQLKKIRGLSLDTNKRRITNIFDYQMYICDNNYTVVYVVEGESKNLLGVLNIVPTSDGLSVTLTDDTNPSMDES